jgi:phosphate starvation-inducible protein PhoH
MLHNLSVVEDYEYHIDHHQRKKVRKQRKIKQTGLILEEVEPLTCTQRNVFDSYESGNNMVLHGCAGTGKTFLSAYLGVRDVLEKVEGKRQVIIVRSVVPTRDMGFLPGNLTEKMKVYESPYRDLLSGMFNRGDAYDILKGKDIINFTTTSFVRGQTWDDAIIIVDEAQNFSFQELNSVITRVGNNSRIIVCGDGKQDDLTSERYNESSGLSGFLSILDRMKSFDILNFTTDDIVRSDFVREYLTICHAMGI